jgi:hypothetical protein
MKVRSFLSHHLCLIVALAASLAVMTLVACQPRTPFILPADPNNPAAVSTMVPQNLTAPQITQLIGAMQAKFDERAAAIQAEQSAATRAAAAATSPAERSAAATQMDATVKDVATYTAQVAAFNMQLQLAEADLEAKRAVQNNLFTSILNIAATPPATAGDWVTKIAAIAGTILATGAGLDSVRKSTIINRLQNGAAGAPASPALPVLAAPGPSV